MQFLNIKLANLDLFILSVFLILSFLIASIGGYHAASSDKELKEILGGQEPTIKLVNEKVSQLKSYTTKKFTDVKADNCAAESIAKIVGMGKVDGYTVVVQVFAK